MRNANTHTAHTRWSRQTDRARRDCSAGPSSRLPSRTALGTVRIRASRMGTPASAADDDGEPYRIVTAQRPKRQCAQQNHHDCRDQMAHRPRRRRRAMVVARDGRKHRLGQFAAPNTAHLDVEDQVHPQHGEQKPAAGQSTPSATLIAPPLGSNARTAAHTARKSSTGGRSALGTDTDRAVPATLQLVNTLSTQVVDLVGATPDR